MPLIGRTGLDKAIKKQVSFKDNQLRGIFLDRLKAIKIGTPIDEGRTRNNWFLKVGAPSTEKTDLTSGNDTYRTRMPKSVLGKRLFFANNLPNINTLEYGGYPNPAKFGSKDKVTGEISIHTKNGFSDQAVGGWVRVEILKMRNSIRKIK